MANVLLRRRGQQRILRGHPWIYQADVERTEGAPEKGDLVDLYGAGHRFLGRGYINPDSQICVRLLTREQEPIDAPFFRRRIAAAMAYRRRLAIPSTAMRMVYAEADALPGLLLDCYGDIVVVQILTAGMEHLRGVWLPAIQELFHPRGILLRNDVPSRLLEGLPLEQDFPEGPFEPIVTIEEEDLRFRVDVATGQKTGFFLDQRENRLAVRPLAAGRQVLDCFCYTGGFALHAGKAGARQVEGIDISEEAVATATANAALNHLADRCTFRRGNVFDELRELERAGRRFDLIILDPPAFTKSKEAVAGALRGYKEINLRAMKLVRPAGILVTSSCSYHLTAAAFLAMLEDAAADARVRCRILAVRTQARDHPSLLGVHETNYLKCVFLERL
ncbi:MAG: class I SAM-dependent rRNA methyltransferase [Candidatus Methylomirabilales bacterium]